MIKTPNIYPASGFRTSGLSNFIIWFLFTTVFLTNSQITETRPAPQLDSVIRALLPQLAPPPAATNNPTTPATPGSAPTPNTADAVSTILTKIFLPCNPYCGDLGRRVQQCLTSTALSVGITQVTQPNGLTPTNVVNQIEGLGKCVCSVAAGQGAVSNGVSNGAGGNSLAGMGTWVWNLLSSGSFDGRLSEDQQVQFRQMLAVVEACGTSSNPANNNNGDTNGNNGAVNFNTIVGLLTSAFNVANQANILTNIVLPNVIPRPNNGAPEPAAANGPASASGPAAGQVGGGTGGASGTAPGAAPAVVLPQPASANPPSVNP
ncbi:hypothetical protein HK102_013633 [Quaeritorhiza haematococci]|nr:hypothetical protein HK102_013633 [Quaeritorhiza haematococci]